MNPCATRARRYYQLSQRARRVGRRHFQHADTAELDGVGVEDGKYLPGKLRLERI